LREEAAKERNYALERNDVAVNANRQYEYKEQLYQLEKKEKAELEMKLNYCNKEIATLKETIEAFKQAQPQDLQTHTCGVCADLKCAWKICSLNDKLYGAQRELAEKDAKLQQLSDLCEKLKRDNEFIKHQTQQASQDDIAPGYNKRKHEESTSTVIARPGDLQATFTRDLDLKFNCLFLIGNPTSVIDENTLYDSFLLDQPENERLEALSQVYAACHDGQDMQERDKKRFKLDLLGDPNDSSRVNKRSFAACLKAMGGVSRRKYNKIVWVNVHLRRQPCFQRKNLG
jgi:hypothetical protein